MDIVMLCKKEELYKKYHHLDRVKRIWYLSPIRAVSPEPSLLAHISSESRGTFRQKTRSLAPLNDWACAVEICHDGMLEDTNSLDGAHLTILQSTKFMQHAYTGLLMYATTVLNPVYIQVDVSSVRPQPGYYHST